MPEPATTRLAPRVDLWRASFGRLGEIAGEYLKKGSKVYLEGKLQTRKWQDQQGQDRYTTEVVADEMQMLDSRGGSAEYAGGSRAAAPQQNQPAAQNTPGPSRRRWASAKLAVN